MNILGKISRNLKSGTLLKNGSTALKNRIIKWRKTSNLFYKNDPKRVMTKEVEKIFDPINEHHYKVGNYFLDDRLPLNSSSVIYSLGIFCDVNFDSAISQKFDCDVHMFDPTPITQEYMKTHAANKHFKYDPIGVWTENSTLRFYIPNAGASASTVNKQGDEYFDAICKSVPNIMKERNHAVIDVFKADIEGAALPIIEKMIEDGIYPNQIIAEFERPDGDIKDTIDFFQRLFILNEKCRALGYQEYLMPRASAKYFSLEILYARIHKS